MKINWNTVCSVVTGILIGVFVIMIVVFTLYGIAKVKEAERIIEEHQQPIHITVECGCKERD